MVVALDRQDLELRQVNTEERFPLEQFGDNANVWSNKTNIRCKCLSNSTLINCPVVMAERSTLNRHTAKQGLLPVLLNG